MSATGFVVLDQAMQRWTDDGELAGIVVLVAVGGEVRYLNACGRMDIETGRPMATDALFRIYSMTKPITSVSLLMLMEEGYFRLEDPVEKYIPGFRELKVCSGVDEDGGMELEPLRRPITILDLFRHTAGLTYGWLTETAVDIAYREAGISYMEMPLRELVDRLTTMPLLYQPGTRWHYSFAHDVQARLVEQFSGQAFEEFLRTRVVEPLQMADTQFGVAPEKMDRYTTSYGPCDRGGLEATDRPESSSYLQMANFPAGGIGLTSTAADYCNFAQMLLNGGELQGSRLLRPETVALMTRNHLPPEAMPINTPGGGRRPGVGYGLGVSVLVDPSASGGPGNAGQFGWGGMASTSILVDPAEQLVALFLAQFTPPHREILAGFRTLVYQALGR